MKNRAIVSYLSALAGAMILLAGCGGGGGGGSSAGPAPTTGGSVAGVAATGTLANANVTAYCGNSQAAADQLATGLTNSAGQYDLSWTTACAGPVLLVVTAGANTTMADEATGTIVIPPAGFELRAFLTDPSTTNVKNITPLTDMAVAIAGTSPTLSAAAASNAESAVIATVLGGDIGAYQATPLPPTTAAMATASADEKKLATVLTAVSAFAEDATTAAACGALTGGTGARIQCAMNALEAQAAATVTAVSDAGYTIATNVPANTPATMLAATLTKIAAEASSGTAGGLITATGPQALATTITADSSGSAVLMASASVSVLAAASTGGVVTLAAAANGVQAASNLFNSLKTDLASLTNSSGNGFLDQQVSAMSTDFTGLAISSATSSVKNLKALGRALELANFFSYGIYPVPAGTLTPNTVYSLQGANNMVVETDSSGALFRFVRSYGDGMNCNAKLNSNGTLGTIGCYYGYGQANVPVTPATTPPTFTGYHHSVVVTESTTTPGTYTWRDYLASRTYTTTLFNNPTYYPLNGNGNYVPTSAAEVATSIIQTGTAVASWDSSGNLTSGSLTGNIQPLVTGQDYSTLNITGMTTSNLGAQEVGTFAGTVTNVKGTTTTLSMALQSGSQIVDFLGNSAIGVPGHPISGKLILQLKTTAFEYDGTLTVNAFTQDKEPSNTDFLPANASFSGTISTLAGGTATPFLKGTLGATLANVAGYDPTQPNSASNYAQPTVTFLGDVTNGGTSYELTAIADGSVYNQTSVTLNYARAGSQMISVTGTVTPTTTTLKIYGTGGVNAVLTNGTGNVYTGTTQVGTITQNPSEVTFTDGTYLLLGV
jgi:hypothetical protein